MRKMGMWLGVLAVLLCGTARDAAAWGGRGHRTIAAIAMALIPEKAAKLNAILAQLESNNNFIDAASYADEFLRSHDPAHQFSAWHYADIPEDGTPFVCGNCLFKALQDNLTIVRDGKGDKAEALAISWVIHLVGDLHQPLHMDARLRGGNQFNVTYRGKATCKSFGGRDTKVELHSVWDDCLVEELAKGRDPKQLAKDLLGPITTFQGRGEILPTNPTPWLSWGDDAHKLAVSVAFDGLSDGADLGNAYIVGTGKALDTVRNQLLIGGIRLAYLLDQVVK